MKDLGPGGNSRLPPQSKQLAALLAASRQHRACWRPSTRSCVDPRASCSPGPASCALVDVLPKKTTCPLVACLQFSTVPSSHSGTAPGAYPRESSTELGVCKYYCPCRYDSANELEASEIQNIQTLLHLSPCSRFGRVGYGMCKIGLVFE